MTHSNNAKTNFLTATHLIHTETEFLNHYLF
jgi:hypothetical protein